MTDIRFDFEGKTALVTGAASGIGRAIALELGASGALVVISDLDAEACRSVVEEIAANGGNACVFAADVSDEDAMREAVEFAQRKGGDLHMAVNNAGIGGPSVPTGEYPAADWRRVIDINLNGVFYGMRWQIPALLRAGGGSIVNMSSILGSVGFAKAAPYVAAKHGLLGLTRTAAMEYAQQGVRVNAVGPAFINTPLLSANLSPETLEALAVMHPMGRIGTPEEVSGLTCFLLSNRASFITGSYHLVDGGYTAP
ncbi:SDR family NAD(P)-dependent oxidoreductase [Paracoccus aerius]|uniref:SDR family NAD(P)-dependent oxidoreductase n=1 Tax=Paracoccus aerius TaxID=1915382 RepID=UPI00174C5BE7|nr:SDR family NAD(P)-dependent oxidoreductase [Paracoccus aerius]GHG36351.1 oxidoreductase [Paracoccus aerius]